MSLLTLWLLVAIGGAFGALLRFWLTRLSAWRWGSSIPATLSVNILGSLILGVGWVIVSYYQHMPCGPEDSGLPAYAMIELGFVGGFTTFSAFAVELRGMLPNHWLRALAYMLGSVLGSVMGLILGYILGGFVVYG
ncbi:CrcB family protein [Aliidiomarina halalkaliphila]|uniref:Fluoride-specific ion channel FluC n=1 Tax=Aliidiomarina halalkaliphila TaxID=2593535 RepID=A0A552X3T2_9GAMM|nr:CrcB family protein [Aliidiomarina halalkaliphila]TRW49697.1 CrcB family protein [Aliidiomarina halalkaliphila]